MIRSKVSKTVSNNSATSDICESNRINATSDIMENPNIQLYSDLESSSNSSLATGTSREGRDLLGVNMYSVHSSTSSNTNSLNQLSIPMSTSSVMCNESNDKPSSHQVTESKKSLDVLKLEHNNSNPTTTNVSNLSTINLSQAGDSLGYSMCYSVSSNSGLDIPETSNKDNFSKPFPLKPETRKSETIRNSHLGQLEASDNHSIRDEHNIKESDNVYESDQKQGEMLSTVPILQDICGKTEDIPSNPQSSKKVTKMDKKVLNEKVRKYFHFLFI